MLTISNNLFRGFDRYFDDEYFDFDFPFGNRRQNMSLSVPLRRVQLQQQQRRKPQLTLEDLFQNHSFFNEGLEEVENFLGNKQLSQQDKCCGCACQQDKQQQNKKQSPLKNRFYSQSKQIRQYQDQNGQIITDISEESNNNGKKNRQKQQLVHDQNSHKLLKNQKWNNEQLMQIEQQEENKEEEKQKNIEVEGQEELNTKNQENKQNDVVIEDESVEQKLGESLDSDDWILQEKL